MKLRREDLQKPDAWPGYRLPAFDIGKMVALTREAPLWLHMGAGNIFRALPAVMQQDLLEAGLTDRGIVVCECYDPSIIPSCYSPYDNLSVLVTLKANGSVEKRVIASVAEAFNGGAPEAGPDRLMEIWTKPSLQMVTFTITEKGYAVTDASAQALPFLHHDLNGGPLLAESLMGRVTAGLLARYNAGARPLALVSLDNCARNGEKLSQAVLFIAKAWQERGLATPGFVDYLCDGRVAFPWSMIDKITPRPSEKVSRLLAADGYEDACVVETEKHTFVSSFVNAEAAQYLVIEDTFPNGRPPLEKAGALLTDRTTVQKAEQMKVGSCLNPLHTILAISGMLLGYATISETVRDQRLAAFIQRAAYDESLPVATHPGVIDPAHFLHEVLTERLPNPFIPDTPARIACDTSQKIPVRFGETLKARLAAGLPVETLEAIPLFFALWLRYLTGVDDEGAPMVLSPDPRLSELVEHIALIKPGECGVYHQALQPILSDASLFGVDLYDTSVRLGSKVESIFEKLNAGPHAVSRVLDNYFTGGQHG